MAGTRLFLQASFTAQLLVLVVSAFYYGLWDDLIARKIFIFSSRDARSLLVASSIVVAPQRRLSFPAVTFVCADSQVSFWHSYLKKFLLEEDHVQVKTHSELHSVCLDPSKLSVSEADVWICEAVPPPTEMRMVISNSSTIIYSRGLRHREEDMQQLYPKYYSARQQNVRITLHVPSQNLVAIWMAATREWLTQNRYFDWPCIGDIQLQQANQFDLSSLATENRTADRDSGTEDADPLVKYTVPLANLFAKLSIDNKNRDATVFGMDLFLPSRFSISFDDQNSSHIQRLNHFLAVLPEATSADNHVELIDAALGAPLETMLGQCMGMPSNLIDLVQFQSLDKSFPIWYTKLWFQRMLSRRYQETLELANEQWNSLLQSHSTVHVTEQVVARWLDAAKLIRQTQTHAYTGKFNESIDNLIK
jgi:hypothetical protein